MGWKNRLFRFNVLWNGCTIAKPNLNRRTEGWPAGRAAENNRRKFLVCTGTEDRAVPMTQVVALIDEMRGAASEGSCGLHEGRGAPSGGLSGWHEVLHRGR